MVVSSMKKKQTNKPTNKCIIWEGPKHSDSHSCNLYVNVNGGGDLCAPSRSSNNVYVWNLTVLVLLSHIPQHSMEPICPIDSLCAHEISALLTPPSPLQIQAITSTLFLPILTNTFSVFHLILLCCYPGVLSYPFVFKAVQCHHCPTRWKLWKGYSILTFVLQMVFFQFSILIMYYSIFSCATGKISGVYAAMDFKEGELVLKDHMFVGVQHFQNKVFP